MRGAYFRQILPLVCGSHAPKDTLDKIPYRNPAGFSLPSTHPPAGSAFQFRRLRFQYKILDDPVNTCALGFGGCAPLTTSECRRPFFLECRHALLVVVGEPHNARSEAFSFEQHF